MRVLYKTFLFLLIPAINIVYAQKAVNKTKFFKDTSVINATLTLDLKKVMSKKSHEGVVFPAVFSCKLGDNLNISDTISVQVRGHFRRSFCNLPPFKLIFKNNPSAAFYQLKSLKLVSTCMPNVIDDQNLLKEFIIYKIYNLLTDKSFRVRLLNLSYQDSSGKKKTITQHAFLIEDIKQLLKRDDCVDWTGKKMGIAGADRRQMTEVAVFEYMIGNTDWSVPANHNIKLIGKKSDSTARPYAIPYDFDFSGLVNTAYSTPDGNLNLESVQQRMYRGLPGSKEDLYEILGVFNRQKASIYAVINNFNMLTSATKKEMTDYLDGFFKTINNPAEVHDIFVANAK